MKDPMKKLMFVALAGVSFSLFAGYKPEPWNLEARQKFAEQRFGIFIHWGLYSNYAQGEWYLNYGGIHDRNILEKGSPVAAGKFYDLKLAL